MKMDWKNIFASVIGQADKRTEEEVDIWRKENKRNEELYQRVRKYYEEEPTCNKIFSEEELDNRFRQLQLVRKGRRLRLLWMRAGVAASVVIALAAGVWLYGEQESGQKRQVLLGAGGEDLLESVVVVTESGERVNIGELQGAEKEKLSYAGGKQLELDRKKLSEKMHTVMVPRGKTFEIELSDGTFVLLNPMSELTYPVRFDTASVREVTLRGEAFFEVTKSKHRFVVNTERMKLQVYGTTFNVVANGEGLEDEAVLVEGSVGITPRNGEAAQEVMIRPGEKSVVNAAGQVTVKETDVAEYIAKRNGYILFNGKTVGQILQELEMYYGVNFTVGTGMKLSDKEYVVSISRRGSLQEALDILELISEVHFTIEGKEVKMSKD